MRRTSLLILLFAGFQWALAQEPDAVRTNARRIVKTLTAPALHGRGYVQNGDGLAADWIGKEFERMGLKPVKSTFFQPFQFNVNSFPDSVKASIDGHVLVPGVEFLVDPASGKASGRYNLVHLTPNDVLDPERKAMTMGVLAGQAACLHLPATSNADSLRMFASIARELMYYAPVVRPAHGKLTWGVSQEAFPYPLVEVASEALTDSSTYIDLHVQNTMLSRHEARNVLGSVKGRGKKWVVVGAHYDHLGRMGPEALFPGANDNASGVAMLLSLAQWYADHRPKHNLLFVAFAGEEAGLLGSEWCAVDRPIDWKQVRMMVNLDILGTGDDGITVVNATAQKEAFGRLVELNAAKGLLPQVKERGPSCNSDHCPFVKRNVPALFIYTMGGIKAYHDVMDKDETLPLTKFPELYVLLKEFINGVK